MEQVFRPKLSAKPSTHTRAFNRAGKIIANGIGTPLEIQNFLDIAQIEREGLPASLYDALIKDGLEPCELPWIINPRTLQRRKAKNEKLTPEESSKVLRVLIMLSLSHTVFGNENKSIMWFRKPLKSLQGYSPLELIQTESGAQTVRDQLNKIDSGYSA